MAGVTEARPGVGGVRGSVRIGQKRWQRGQLDAHRSGREHGEAGLPELIQALLERLAQEMSGGSGPDAAGSCVGSGEERAGGVKEILGGVIGDGNRESARIPFAIVSTLRTNFRVSSATRPLWEPALHSLTTSTLHGPKRFLMLA